MGLVRDYSLDNQRTVVEGNRKAWRRNFNGSALDPDIWELRNKGAGQTVTVTGGALTVNQGVGINEETVIRSVARFQIPFRVQFSMWMNQRIAQNEVFLELVNAAGDTYTGWMFDGTVNTTAKTIHANGGFSLPASPTGGITVTASSGSTIREIEARIDSTEFFDRPVDSNAAAATRLVKTRTTLDPYEDYFVQLRFRNVGGIAPASGTITTLETILVQDTNDVLVEVNAGRGQGSTGKSIPVNVNNQNTTMLLAASSSTSVASLTAFRNGAITNAGVNVKSSQGKLYAVAVSNPGASAAFFNVYNTTAPVIGTTAPALQLLIPAGQTITYQVDTFGILFSAAINVAATDTSAILSAIAPATPLLVNVAYA